MSVQPKERGSIIRCACCGLEREIYLDSPSAQQVCDECKAHHNRNPERIRELHRNWWIAHDEEQFSNYTRIVGELREQIREAGKTVESKDAQLNKVHDLVVRRFEDAPVGALQTWLQSGVVLSAQGARDSAFRRRDRAMRALWRIDRLHNEDAESGNCKCGLKADKCAVLKVLASETDNLDSWEIAQLNRLSAGKEHGLPREHPEVMKREGHVALRV